MIPAGQEVILGAVRDQQFGPLVMFGTGGVEVETVRDVAFGLAPFSRVEAEGLINSTQAGRRLKGYRGIPQADRAAVVEALLRVGQLAVDQPEISRDRGQSAARLRRRKRSRGAGRAIAAGMRATVPLSCRASATAIPAATAALFRSRARFARSVAPEVRSLRRLRRNGVTSLPEIPAATASISAAASSAFDGLDRDGLIGRARDADQRPTPYTLLQRNQTGGRFRPIDSYTDRAGRWPG